MDKDVKIANSKDIDHKMPKDLHAIKIVRLEDIDSKIPSVTLYALKVANDGINYLAELPLVWHDYSIYGYDCFLYEDLKEEEKMKYKDVAITVMAKFADVQYYEKPKKKQKTKVISKQKKDK